MILARIRTIKPEFWTDERMVELTFTERLFYVGTWNFADDNGNLKRSAKTLKMQIFPADAIDCEPIIQSLINAGRLIEYAVDGETFLHIREFHKNQVINRPSRSLIPAYPGSTNEQLDLPTDSLSDTLNSGGDSVSTHGAITEGSLREGKGRERSKPRVVAARLPAWQPPAWIPVDKWHDFEEMRRKQKRPMTDAARDLAIGKLDRFRTAGHNIVSIIDNAVEHGWMSFYEPKEPPAGIASSSLLAGAI